MKNNKNRLKRTISFNFLKLEKRPFVNKLMVGFVLLDQKFTIMNFWDFDCLIGLEGNNPE